MPNHFIKLITLGFCLITPSWLAAQANDEADNSNYILRPGDAISVQVFGQADLSLDQEISNKGAINMGLIGVIEVARLTVVEAEAKIRNAYMDQQFLRDPQVIIAVTDYSPKLVSVLGQVNSPGSVQLPKDENSISLARVISMVGDFRGIAKKDAIRVVRKNEKGEEITLIVDMSDIGKNNRAHEDDIDFLIYPDDVIYVPERLF